MLYYQIINSVLMPKQDPSVITFIFLFNKKVNLSMFHPYIFEVFFLSVSRRFLGYGLAIAARPPGNVQVML